MNILIIGKDSYIGNNINQWLLDYGHQVVQLDVLTDEWKVYDYSRYDTIIHVAGIVHKPECKDWNLYEYVNTYMPVAVADMAKQQGVGQFIYFSTMGVYDGGKKLSSSVITKDSSILKEGNTMYGKSKALAEDGLAKLVDDTFTVSLIRPPSVYGKNCRGGYISGFTKIVRMLPVIPQAYTDVRQSFVYIDNLSECVRIIVENKLGGIFCPQDDVTPNANELFRAIAVGIGKKYRDSRFLGICMQMVSWLPLVKKAYGGIEYSRELSEIKGYDYVVVPFSEGMRRTVSK